MPAAVVPRTEDVVQGQAGVVERLRGERDPVDREQQRFQPDEVRREVEQPRPLGERLADQPEAELLEVAEAAVDQPRRARRRPGGDVVLLDERGAHPARHGVEERPAADDAAADDDDVPRAVGEGLEIGAATGDRVGRRSRPRLVPRLVGRPARDPPEQPARADDEDEDRERRVEDDLLDGRRQQARERRQAEHDRDHDQRDDRDLAPARLAAGRASTQPRSASGGMPIGATRTLPACATPRRVASPVLGRWKVTVRSARTAGLGRLAAREVDRGRRVDGHDRDAARRRPDDELDGRADRLAQRPAARRCRAARRR